MTRIGLLLLAALAALALALPPAPTDNSVQALLGGGHAQTRANRRIQSIFGTDEIVLVRIAGPDLEPVLATTASVARTLRGSDVISHVLAPDTAFSDLVPALQDPVFAELLEPEEVARTLDGPLNRSLGLLDLDPPSAVVLALGRVAAVPPREALVAQLDALRARARKSGLDLVYAGPPVLNLALDRAGRTVQATALPVLIGLVIVLLGLLTRRPGRVVALLLPVGLVVATSDALTGALGATTNLVVDAAKPLLLVLLLASGLHIAIAFDQRRRRGEGAGPAAAGAGRDKARATVFALGTTALGFSSLGLSGLQPIAAFGGTVALGCLLGIPVLRYGLPALLALERARARSGPAPRAERLAVALVRGATARPALAIGAGVLALAAGIASATAIRTEPHAIRYFPPDHPVRADYEALEARGYGLSTLEVVVTSTVPWVDAPARLARLARVMKGARNRTGVRAAIGVPVLLEEAERRATGIARIPRDPARIATLLDAEPELTRQFLTEDGRTTRIALTVGTVDAEDLDALDSWIASALGRPFGFPVKHEVTGNYALLLRAQRELLYTLIESLFMTAVLMQLALLVAFRSLGLAAIALVPNLVPVAAVFVVLGGIGVPLDVGTAMTAAVALAIAVDDTLHFVLAWDPERPEVCARSTGQAIVISSVVIAAGFLSLAASDFAPLRRFGLLAATALFTALLADLVVLPALLAKVGPRRHAGSATPPD